MNNPKNLSLLALLLAAADGVPNRGTKIYRTAAEALDDPAYQKFAAENGVDLYTPTPGCNCEMCVEIRMRANAASVRGADEPSRKGGCADGAFAYEAPFRGEPRPNAADILDEGAATYRQRNALYGDSYKEFGKVMKALYPNGMPDFATVDDFNRLGVFIMIISKVMRYSTNLGTGGHRDSALDLSVYAAMLAELTNEGK